MVSPFIDPANLRTTAYADPRNLSARQRLWSFRSGPSFHERVVSLIDWSEVRSLVDVGCGNAIYLDRIRAALGDGACVVGLDLSEGMLASARHPTGRVVADAQRLPIRDASVDVALALHMLYHLPNPPDGIRELRRVTRDGGVTVVSANGSTHLAELAGFATGRTHGSQRVGLERAEEMLRAEFSIVERHDFVDRFEVTDADAIVDYLRSTISLGADSAAVRDAEGRVRAVVESEGTFVLTAAPGVLLCR